MDFNGTYGILRDHVGRSNQYLFQSATFTLKLYTEGKM